MAPWSDGAPGGADGFVTVVSGLPRSGTSLMMQMLQAGGLPVLTDGVRGADENNRRGYLEFEPVKRLRERNDWLAQARGQAVKVIHLLLRHLALQGELRYRIVFMRRPLDEVLASQRAMLARDGRPAGDPAVLRRAFEKQLAELDTWLASQARISVLPAEYHAVLKNPAEEAGRVQAFLGLPLDVDAMARCVDPILHRERS